MSGLINIAGTWIWYVICVAALILFVGTLGVLFRFLMDKRRVAPMIIVLLNLQYGSLQKPVFHKGNR